MTRSLLAVARDHAGGRCAAVLEGGYDLDALPSAVSRVLDELGGENLDAPFDEPPSSDAPDPRSVK